MQRAFKNTSYWYVAIQLEVLRPFECYSFHSDAPSAGGLCFVMNPELRNKNCPCGMRLELDYE